MGLQAKECQKIVTLKLWEQHGMEIYSEPPEGGEKMEFPAQKEKLVQWLGLSAFTAVGPGSI